MDKYPFIDYFKCVSFEENQVVKHGKLGDYINYMKTYSAYNKYVEKNKNEEDFEDPIDKMIHGIKKDMKSYCDFKKYADNIEDIEIKFINDFIMYTMQGVKQNP